MQCFKYTLKDADGVILAESAPTIEVRFTNLGYLVEYYRRRGHPEPYSILVEMTDSYWADATRETHAAEPN